MDTKFLEKNALAIKFLRDNGLLKPDQDELIITPLDESEQNINICTLLTSFATRVFKKLDAELFYQVLMESDRAVTKHGVQLHIPSIDPMLVDRGKERICEEYEIPTEARAKAATDIATKRGDLTWAHIAIEELSEAVCASNETHMREELIQLMSVCERWIEAIDARAGVLKTGLKD